ncbi:hypothetical protein [Paraburkholderia sp. MM5384-R2]|uniref:hypothetical protein n=1 Tax=Paraburkholderia sp. MM5384-R2 TaxID=2723097 RepID=UPI0017A47530|nr:hypothetical protein [Paraburkholderia sp. MM5384-R2]MBB5499349.1 NADPH:quinone reductase-like Zn-dependent oxidoreductase [Paraburkholderia sp. MM5384-R2]
MQFAALPETYAPVWTCHHRNVELKAGQRLVARGGTSSPGRQPSTSALNSVPM